jgi:hypothetical protein
MAAMPFWLEPMVEGNPVRNAASAAGNAATTAQQTAAGYGATNATVGSSLIPFESRQLTNPSGMSQQDIGAQLAAGLGASGGATAALAGAASKDAATARNPMGFSAALDAASRNREKANAGTAEGIYANNANVKLQQQNQAANTLSGLYGMSANAQNNASRQIAPDVGAQVNASNSGWLQNAMGVLGTLNGTGLSLANMKAQGMLPGMGG